VQGQGGEENQTENREGDGMNDKIQKIIDKFKNVNLGIVKYVDHKDFPYEDFSEALHELIKSKFELSKQSKDTAFNMKEINLRRAAEANLNALKEENVGLLACIRKLEAKLSKSKDIYCENGHAEVVEVGNAFKCVKCGEIFQGISLKPFLKKMVPP
jgi:uncharacterized protein YfkK (UPF0435 family)